MMFAPEAPTIHVPPTRVSADTFVLLRGLPDVPPPPLPDQIVLDVIRATVG